MSDVENGDTRYFVEIELESLKLIRCGFEQKQNLNKGHQTNPDVHRLFLTKGQYHKLVQRCEKELADIMDEH